MKNSISLLLFIICATSGFSQNEIDMIFPGQFHDDEIDNEFANHKWFGLFELEDYYYLRKTNIQISKIYDPIADDDSLNPTGDLVQVESEGNCVLLIKGISGLKERPVIGFGVEDNSLLPGEETTFNYNDLHYNLSAEGDPLDTATGWLNGNYRLILEETNQLNSKQLISEDSMYSETPYSIIWIGDLDGDNEIDLLIDLSNHYNVSLPVLFLSSRKTKGNLLKRSAEFSSVGC